MSISGFPKMVNSLVKTDLSNFHSVLSLNNLEAWSAWIFSFPGMWAAVRYISLLIHHSHTSRPIALHAKEWVPPMLFKYDTVVVLSDRIFMWQLCFPLHRDWRPINTALSSNMLMCCPDSAGDQRPPVTWSEAEAPQPNVEASVDNVILKPPWCIFLLHLVACSSHQWISVIAMLDRLIVLSKFPLAALKAWALSISNCL